MKQITLLILVLFVVFVLMNNHDQQHRQEIPSRAAVEQLENHDDIILQDLQNKQNELTILREIRMAQANHDEESFRFFLEEYMDVPRLTLNDSQKQHPMYKEWLSDDIIKTGEFMDPKYNFVNH